jgi:effector-binding domain-containing protein
MVTYTGATEHIAQVTEALREAAADAGQSLTGESIEVYRTNEDDELTVDIGLRLAQP